MRDWALPPAGFCDYSHFYLKLGRRLGHRHRFDTALRPYLLERAKSVVTGKAKWPKRKYITRKLLFFCVKIIMISIYARFKIYDFSNTAFSVSPFFLKYEILAGPGWPAGVHPRIHRAQPEPLGGSQRGGAGHATTLQALVLYTISESPVDTTVVMIIAGDGARGTDAAPRHAARPGATSLRLSRDFELDGAASLP